MSDQTFADIGIEIPAGRAGEVDVLCPQCSHMRKKSRARCLSVNTELGTWFCHHCGWAGAVGMSGVGSPYGAPYRHQAATPKRAYDLPRPLPDVPLPRNVIEWFARRGIPEWVLAEAGIRWGDGAILFPFWRDGQLVNIKHRTLDKRFWMEAGAERILYNLDACVGAHTIVIVEGEIDALSIRTAGGPPTLSVPDGAPPADARHYASKFSFLDSSALTRLSGATTLFIGPDMDPPGVRLGDELAARLGIARCKRLSWAPYKDANALLVEKGPQAVLDAIAGAEPFAVLLDADLPCGARPVRQLPPPRGRRPVIELTPTEHGHAG